MYKVGILIDQKPPLFELGIATELFAVKRPEFKNWYQAEVISFSQQPIETNGGLKLTPKVVSSLQDYENLIIPGWQTEAREPEPTIINELVKFSAQKKRILTYCSGAFLLAETQLLNGTKATTHWRYATKFKQRYPNIIFSEDVLYELNSYFGCSAGSASAIDLSLEVIRQDFGYEIANQVARRMVMAPHRSGGQSQFVETPMVTHNNHFSNTLDWAIDHLAESLSINDLASHANMSRRNFDRLFRKSLNMSPKQWLVRQQLIHAKRLLETTDKKIEQIATESGFVNAMNIRHHFKTQLAISPNQYRTQFSK